MDAKHLQARVSHQRPDMSMEEVLDWRALFSKNKEAGKVLVTKIPYLRRLSLIDVLDMSDDETAAFTGHGGRILSPKTAEEAKLLSEKSSRFVVREDVNRWQSTYDHWREKATVYEVMDLSDEDLDHIANEILRMIHPPTDYGVQMRFGTTS